MHKIGTLLFFFSIITFSLGQDTLYTSVSGDTLTIHHDQTERNCGALFTFDVSLDDSLITITEIDTGGLAYCMCLFDLEVSLTGLEPGTFQIDVWSNDIGSDPVFQGSLDLLWDSPGLVGHEESNCLSSRDDTAFIELYEDGDTLNLFWNTPLLNCGFIPEWSGWLATDTFHVTMVDTGMAADCVCSFETVASFASFSPGTYTLDFWNGEYGYPQFTITNLRDNPSISGEYQSPCYNITAVADECIGGMSSSDLTYIKCYPNPFNGQVSISYQVLEPTEVAILIYDIQGRFVTRLKSSAFLQNGSYELVWHGADQQGRNIGSGLYLLVFQSSKQTFIKRLLVIG